MGLGLDPIHVVSQIDVRSYGPLAFGAVRDHASLTFFVVKAEIFMETFHGLEYATRLALEGEQVAFTLHHAVFGKI